MTANHSSAGGVPSVATATGVVPTIPIRQPATHAEAGPVSLRPFASCAGAICVLALDHRDAMRNAYERLGVHEVSEQVMRDAKARIMQALAPRASAILLDGDAVSLPRPSGRGLLMPLETQGHDKVDGGRVNHLMHDFSPARAAELGAHGCKLLLYYRADHVATAERQLRLAAKTAAACHRHGLALVVEPKVYPLVDEDLGDYQQRFGKLIVAAANDLAHSGADLLKLQYPGSRRLCERITEAASPLQWTLLGGVIDGETFASQLLDSYRAGACGFIAGRAIWGDALALEPARQRRWLANHAEPLFNRLCAITDTYARRIA